VYVSLFFTLSPSREELDRLDKENAELKEMMQVAGREEGF
jgi:hypothetical protein